MPKPVECKETFWKIGEARKDGTDRTYYPITIIRQGLGNLKDKNYYTAEAITNATQVYEGKQAYFDHPTPEDEEQRPNRSVKELVGHYEDVTPKTVGGLVELQAKLYPIKGKEEATSLMDHSVAYKKKYPDKDFIGISINGDGEGKEMEYEEFLKEVKPTSEELSKIKDIEGQKINVITKLTDAFSADLVTAAGAGGKFLKEQKQILRKRSKDMAILEGMKKLFRGLDSGDTKLAESAVKDMLQQEDEDEGKKKEAEKKEADGADTLAKHLLLMKKEMKQKEGEADEAYEKRVIHAAMKAHKKESEDSEKKESKKEDEDSEKKEADEKKEKKEKKDKKEDEDSEKKESEDESEKKEKKESKKEDDDGDDDDSAKMKKMAKKQKELEDENAKLKKEKKESEDEGKKHKEELVVLKAEKKLKERAELIDDLLAESGLRREITKNFRPVLEACSSTDDVKATAKRLFEATSKVMESEFEKRSNVGFAEITSEGGNESNDHLFGN